MHSMLITSKDKKRAMDYIQTFCRKNKIDIIDTSLYSFEKAIGIQDVRNIHKQLVLRPFKGKVKVVVILAYDNITTEAQNALLKALEEPPANTIIIIAISRKELILSTIISRCKIIELKEDDLTLSNEENAQYLKALISLSQKGIGYKLKLAQDIAKNKGDVIPELEKMIIVAREALIDSVCHSEGAKRLKNLRSFAKHRLVPGFANAQDDNGETSQYLNILISLNKTYTVLKTTNVNPRLALENLFLNL